MVGERKSIREDVPHQPKNNLVPPIKLKDFPKFSISIRNFIVVSEMTLNLFLSRAKPTVYNSGSGLNELLNLWLIHLDLIHVKILM